MQGFIVWKIPRWHFRKKVNEKGEEEENGKMLEKGRMKTYVRKVLC